ncbi:MAG: hypothetical protein KGI27_09130 [Thaumarchaeota archaeon]|nr:hypothetical protein [Nitrososphaerota archaeon]
MMNTFKEMINHYIRIGLESNVSTLRRFSSMFYHELDCYLAKHPVLKQILTSLSEKELQRSPSPAWRGP